MEPGVVEGDGGESTEFSGKVDLASVFKVVHQCAAFSITMQGGFGEIEGEIEIVAVRADEIGVDLPVIALAALATEGWGDEVQGVCAGVTEVATLSQGSLAQVAGRWVDEVEKPVG